MWNQYETRARAAYAPEASPEALTARQREVLELLCEGLQNKQIARRLNIAGATVKIHVANILRTLNVTSRLQAAVVAMSVGFGQQAEGARQMRAEIAPAARHPAILRLVPADDHEIDMPMMHSDWSLEAAAG